MKTCCLSKKQISRLGMVTLSLAGWITLANPALAQTDGAIEAIKAVGPKGKGNPAAASAWKELVSKGAEGLVPALEALDEDSAISANWLRPALDAMAEKAQQQGQTIPLARLESFVQDRSKGRAARNCALEVLQSQNEEMAGKILENSLDDPSGEIRRKAIAKALGKVVTLPKVDQEKQLLALFDKAADIDQVEKIAKSLKDLGKEVNVRDRIGFMTKWSVVGPFDNSDNKGFLAKLPLETGPIDLAAKVPGPKGELVWKEHDTSEKSGVIDLNKLIANEKSVVAFAFTRVNSDREQRAQLRIGSITSIRVYLNGNQVYEHDEYHHGMSPDQYIVDLNLKPGTNTFLIKVGQNDKAQPWEKNWQFQARVTDLAGAKAPVSLIGPK